MGRAAAARDDPGRYPKISPQEDTRHTIDVGVDAEEEDDIPIGQVAEAPDDDELMEEDEKLQSLVESDDETCAVSTGIRIRWRGCRCR